MKLRIQGNSLRLRLKQTEVEAFAATGEVGDQIAVAPGMRLVYGLIVADIDRVAVAFDGRGLTVRVPRAVAGRFTGSEQVGFEARIDVGDSELEVLVEKDFRCLHQRAGEDESDNFPHPAEAEE